MNFLLTDHMIRYAWKELAQRAGIAEFTKDDRLAGVPVAYGKPAEITFNQPGIIIESTGADDICRLLKLEEDSLVWAQMSHLMPSTSRWSTDNIKLPILLWGEGVERNNNGSIRQRADGTVVVSIDMIAATIFMLTRWEEIAVTERDHHDRFPVQASVAYKQRFLDYPIIDLYAQILQAWLQYLNLNWQPQYPTFEVKLSHDIDWIAPYPSWKYGFRRLVGDVVKRREWQQARETYTKLLSSFVTPDRTPQMQGIYLLAKVSEQANLTSVFNIMASVSSSFDSGYNPTSTNIRQCIAQLLHAGHEIGFHPGYYTYDNYCQLEAEKIRLDNALSLLLDKDINSGRQHYLRFKAPDTWLHWHKLGMRYDSTLGYADHEGFRCGTCHQFNVFDIEGDQELDLVEIPLIVMDETLRSYRDMNIDEAHERIIYLARICFKVGGTFTLLWHNTSLLDNWSAWGNRYAEIVQELATLQRQPSASTAKVR